MDPVGDKDPCLRTGCAVLSLTARPLCAPVLRAHVGGPLRFADLCRRSSHSGESALRTEVTRLRAAGALERRPRNRMPYAVENELSALGLDLVDLFEVLEAWLTTAPGGPRPLGSKGSARAVRALVAAWNSTVLHALAGRPRSLAELDRLIPQMRYPSLERRLSALRQTGLAQSVTPRDGRPCALTEWARAGVRPLLAAALNETRHLVGIAARPNRADIEAALLLGVPLVKLPEGIAGTCLMSVASDRSPSGDTQGGVRVEVKDGNVVSCISGREPAAAAWVAGDPQSWLASIVEGRHGGMRKGGDTSLVGALLAGLSTAR